MYPSNCQSTYLSILGVPTFRIDLSIIISTYLSYLSTYLSIYQTIELSRGSTLCPLYVLGQPYVTPKYGVNIMSGLPFVSQPKFLFVIDGAAY